MNTEARIKKLLPVLKLFPELGPQSWMAWRELLRLELGHEKALDEKVSYGRHRTRAVAPHMIYHICAGNLAVSGWQSVVWGLVLGAHNLVKVSRWQVSAMERFYDALPREMRGFLDWETEISKQSIHNADAVIVFGQDETVEALRREVVFPKIFLGYGQQASFICGAVNNAQVARRCAYDISMYDQGGCLSPQAVYLPHQKKNAMEEVASLLAVQMEYWNKRLLWSPRDLSAQSQVMEARDLARARGCSVWGSPQSLDWTIILDPEQELTLSCSYRVLFVRCMAEQQLAKHLAPVKNCISTVGYTEPLLPQLVKIWEDSGAKRFCPVGTMQHPPLTWHHDGRPNLGDLVKWVDYEGKVVKIRG